MRSEGFFLTGGWLLFVFLERFERLLEFLDAFWCDVESCLLGLLACLAGLWVACLESSQLSIGLTRRKGCRSCVFTAAAGCRKPGDTEGLHMSSLKAKCLGVAFALGSVFYLFLSLSFLRGVEEG